MSNAYLLADDENDFLTYSGLDSPAQDFGDENLVFIEHTDFTFEDEMDVAS